MDSITKAVAVLGSTGSIGTQTLDIVRSLPQHFRIIGLACGKKSDLLAKQVNEFKPRFIYSQDKEINARLAESKCQFLSLEDIASHPDVDIVVMATSGKWGLKPTLAAIKAGKKIALSNKETLVMAGRIITAEARKSGAQILPVDSEHSAIWQCLSGEKQKPLKLIITASGGPFRELSLNQLNKVTPEQALKHPSWRMGKKVTIDSATLMNKGLEVIEARWLFDMPFDSIKVLIHPQSIIHSMVEFADGSVKAQLSQSDMRLPIQYALSYPERLSNPDLPRIDWDALKSLNFELPDYEKFPCLKLAVEAGKKGGTYTSVLSAADEVAVEMFLSGRTKFADIPKLVELALEKHKAIAKPDLEEIMTADKWARETVLKELS